MSPTYLVYYLKAQYSIRAIKIINKTEQAGHTKQIKLYKLVKNQIIFCSFSVWNSSPSSRTNAKKYSTITIVIESFSGL